MDLSPRHGRPPSCSCLRTSVHHGVDHTPGLIAGTRIHASQSGMGEPGHGQVCRGRPMQVMLVATDPTVTLPTDDGPMHRQWRPRVPAPASFDDRARPGRADSCGSRHARTRLAGSRWRQVNSSPGTAVRSSEGASARTRGRAESARMLDIATIWPAAGSGHGEVR
jgi:hypothetical protein